MLSAAVPLLGAAEAVAALGAGLSVRASGADVDPELGARLDAVLATLGIGEDVAALDRADARALAGLVGGLLGQAAALASEPERVGWDYEDPRVLEAVGQTSTLLAPVFRSSIVPRLGGNLAARLEAETAAMLDVGVGVAAFAVALCRIWPRLRVVGLDPWEPALALARDRVAAAGLQERIELRRATVETLADVAAFDLAWVPTFFIPGPALEPAIDRVHAALRPGGAIVLGLYARPPDPVAAAIAELRTQRQGGTRLTPEQAADLLGAAGFTDVEVLFEPTWKVFVVCAVGRRRDSA